MQIASASPFRARAARLATRLGDCSSGLALTEFAFALPILLTLGLAGLETANLAMAHLRVSNIAVLTADNASRVRDSIDEADIIELFVGAKMAGASIGFAQNGRIVLSSVEERPCDDDGNNGHGNSGGNDCSNPGGGGGGGASNTPGQWIRWQRCDGAKNFTSTYGPEDTGKNNNNLKFVGKAPNQIAAQPGTAVMLAEVAYTYQPIIPNSFLRGYEIRYESAFNVRQRVNQALLNRGNLSSSARKTCNRFQA